MSYVLYDSRSAKVSLIKEITYLQNYIDLEKLRFGNRLELDFDISGQIEEIHVPPLLLLPFLENTFKHGVNLKTGKVDVRIRLTIDKNQLSFEIENPMPPLQINSTIKPSIGGIGLSNVQRRLDLLYPNRYELKIGQEGDIFRVSLLIPIE
jgi:two-component system, LytTR family, sensor kinase